MKTATLDGLEDQVALVAHADARGDRL